MYIDVWANSYIYSVYFLTSLFTLFLFTANDSSLTVQNLYGVTTSVRLPYDEIKYCFEVPDSVCAQIEANRMYPDEEKKRKAMICYFLETNPNASWSLFAALCYERENFQCMQAVQQFLHRTTG